MLWGLTPLFPKQLVCLGSAVLGHMHGVVTLEGFPLPCVGLLGLI